MLPLSAWVYPSWLQTGRSGSVARAVSNSVQAAKPTWGEGQINIQMCFTADTDPCIAVSMLASIHDASGPTGVSWSPTCMDGC